MGSKIYEYIKITDTTNLSGLTFLEKVRAYFSYWFDNSGYADVHRTKNLEELTAAELTLQADLMHFLNRATKPIRDGKHNSVIVDLSSKFETVLDAVLDSVSIKPYYAIKEIKRPRPDINIEYTIRLGLEAIR